MRIIDIILKKRQGEELSTEEIEYFVQAYTGDKIPDYQVSALLMAIYFQKMTQRETVDLTKAMMKSGDILDLTQINGLVVDKHSTGGVGDKTTLILAPLVASCGIPMAKMSGRGLGHTGGTIDKLEAIKGLNTQIQQKDFIIQVNTIGMAIASQTGNLAPADKKIYALRDVTTTVDELSLIASSVMSKKLASGAQGILLDVKVGHGAFMKTQEEAHKLAQVMIDIGKSMGRTMSAVISDMDQPLGNAIGNAIEVKEAIETLQGSGPEDLYELSIILGAKLLIMAGCTQTREEAIEILEEKIKDGSAYKKFLEFVQAQGGSADQVEKLDFPEAKIVCQYKSEKEQYIKEIHAENIGRTALILGAGRENKESQIDLAAGIYLNKKVGDKVKKEEIIGTIYANSENKARQALEKLKTCYKFALNSVEKRKLILGELD